MNRKALVIKEIIAELELLHPTDGIGFQISTCIDEVEDVKSLFKRKGRYYLFGFLDAWTFNRKTALTLEQLVKKYPDEKWVVSSVIK